MNPTKPEDGGEQYNNQQTGQREGIEAPVSASQRDLMKAEQKAADARTEAKEAKRMTVEETETVRRDVEELREENEELRELVGRLIGALHRVDEHLTSIEEDIGAWGNSYETEAIGEIFELPRPNQPLEEEEEEDESDIPVPFTDEEE